MIPSSSQRLAAACEKVGCGAPGSAGHTHSSRFVSASDRLFRMIPAFASPVTLKSYISGVKLAGLRWGAEPETVSDCDCPVARLGKIWGFKLTSMAGPPDFRRIDAERRFTLAGANRTSLETVKGTVNS